MTGNARLVDLRLGVEAVPSTQASHFNSSSKVTSTSINVSTSISSIRGSFISSSNNNTSRTTRKEEIRTSARTTRYLAFLS
jgi:hypothetical protein